MKNRFFGKWFNHKSISQGSINKINFLIALFAFIFSIPSALNQLTEFLNNNFSVKKTNVVYYSPPKINTKNSDDGDCWGSIASERIDAARCANSESSIYDPCFLISDNEHVGKDTFYYFCPVGNTSSEGVIIKSRKGNYISSSYVFTKESTKSAGSDNRLPWLIEFQNGVGCQMETGTIEPSFDNKYQEYVCPEHISVTTDRVVNGNYYFRCKYKDKTYYEECMAKTVVF